jgi:hypothetical protein
MKREAVQEERQRSTKFPIKSEEINSTSSMRDVTVERILEAEQTSESKAGDNAIPYLRVGPNSMVPPEYKVFFYILNQHIIIYLPIFTFIFRALYRIYARWSTSNCFS